MTSGEMEELLLAAMEARNAADPRVTFTTGDVGNHLDWSSTTIGARLSILEDEGLIHTPRNGPSSQKLWSLTEDGVRRVQTILHLGDGDNKLEHSAWIGREAEREKRRKPVKAGTKKR